MAPLRGYGPHKSLHISEKNDSRLHEFTSPEDINLDPVRSACLLTSQRAMLTGAHTGQCVD